MAKVNANGLLPGTKYVVQLQAVDDKGSKSAWSTKLRFTTMSDSTGPSPITDLTWVVHGSSFIADWTGPTTNSDGSPLLDFAYYYLVVTNGTINSPQLETTSTHYEFTLNNALAVFGSRQANLTVTVYVVDTSGNVSTGVSATVGQAPPGDPTNVVAIGVSDGIKVSFDGITDASLDHYEIATSSTNAGPWISRYTGPSTSYTITDTDYTPQYVQVSAWDAFGQQDLNPPVVGPVSPQNPNTVDNTPPPQPTSLTISNEQIDSLDNSGALRQVTATWILPDNPGNDTSGNTLSYKTATDALYTYVDMPDPSSNTAIVHGLAANTTYTFRIQTYDTSNNLSLAASTTYTTGKDTVAPGQPDAPVAVGTTSFDKVQVSHNLLLVDNVTPMPSDIAFLSVYFSTNSTVTAIPANYLGNIVVAAPIGGTIIPANGTFPVPAASRTNSNDTTTISNTYYVAVTATDNSGNTSPISPSVAVTVGLISGLNVASATITDANIHDLTVTKLTAGTGLVTNFTVYSTLTLGTTSGTGKIQSSDYAAGSTGWKLATNGLEINNGVIRAAALLLQDSANLMAAGFADFELVSNYYSSLYTASGSVTYGQTSPGWKGIYALNINASSAATQYLALSSADYNISITGGLSYIVSAYINPSSTQSFALSLADNAGTVSTTTSQSVSSGGWTRISGVVTANVNATAARLAIVTSGAVNFSIDGVQVEWQTSAATTPSVWKPPSFTTIDGGMITTGTIQSSINVSSGGLIQPAWSLNLNGALQCNYGLFRGHITVGDGSGTPSDQWIGSYNYISGSAGWQIRGDGHAEFGDIVARGNITATSGFIGSSTSGVGWTINSTNLSGVNLQLYGNGQIIAGLGSSSLTINGNSVNGSTGIWAGNSVFSSAPFSVDLDGNLVASSANIKGYFQTGDAVNYIRFFSYLSTDVEAFYYNSFLVGYLQAGSGAFNMNGVGSSFVQVASPGSLFGDSVYINGHDNLVLGSTTGSISLNSSIFTFYDFNLNGSANINNVNSINFGGNAAINSISQINNGGGTTTVGTSFEMTGTNVIKTDNIPAYGNSPVTAIWASGNSPSQLGKASSSARYKKNIVDLDLDEAKQVFKVNSRKHQWRKEMLADGDQLNDDEHWSFIAEEVHEAGLKDFVHIYRGEIDGVDYAKFVVPHNAILKYHEDKINDLYKIIKKLTTK